MATVNLTKGQFMKRIADYEKNPGEFKFLGDKPALIDFYAGWCAPCKMFAPVFEEVSAEYTGRVDFYKVDVEQEEKLASLFSVRSIPTLVFIPLNGPIRITQGAVGKPQLREEIEGLLFKQ